jgi:hypothetical protein
MHKIIGKINMLEAGPIRLFYSIFNQPVFCPAVITVLPPARSSKLKQRRVILAFPGGYFIVIL